MSFLHLVGELKIRVASIWRMCINRALASRVMLPAYDRSLEACRLRAFTTSSIWIQGMRFMVLIHGDPHTQLGDTCCSLPDMV